MEINSEDFNIKNSPFNRISQIESPDFSFDIPSNKNLFEEGVSTPDFSPTENKLNEKTPLGNRINDIDTNLLENNAYNKVEDENFVLEQKIEKLEAKLNIVEKKISMASSFDNLNLLEELNQERLVVIQELRNLRSKYKDKGLENKISDNISLFCSGIKNKIHLLDNIYGNILNLPVINKVCAPLRKKHDLKSMKKKLTQINENVSQLTNSKVPYGEYEMRYNMLADYLTKARTINHKIDKEVK